MTRSLFAVSEVSLASAHSSSGPSGDTATVPSASRIAAQVDTPPLQRRLLANRENARKSTGPKTVEGKAASRSNATRHGMTAQLALPSKAAGEIAVQFWQIAGAYRPVEAVSVNAMLELAICSWKFRRLFEQYVCHNAVNRLSVNESRIARDKRQAQRWFRGLAQDARKSLAHLERTFAGLTMIVGNLDNLVNELGTPEGSWSGSQLLLAINLSGFDEHEIWDNVQLRMIWSAWFACRPGRKASLTESPSCLPAYAEYRTRARHAMEDAPLPAEGRRQLIEWACELRTEFTRKLEALRQVEDQIGKLQPMAAGWPAPEETSQHLLHLRYANQVDRKTRELIAIITARPAYRGDGPWKLDESLLPPDWKATLLCHRPGQNQVEHVEDEESCGADLSLDTPFPMPAVGDPMHDRILEAIMRKMGVIDSGPASQPPSPSPPPAEPAEIAQPSNEAAKTAEPAEPQPSSEFELAQELTFSSPPPVAVTADSFEPSVEELAPASGDPANPPDESPVAVSDIAEAPVCVIAESEGDRQPSPPLAVTDPPKWDRQPGPARSSASANRRSRRKLRHDKAADPRNNRQPHAVSQPARPIDPTRT